MITEKEYELICKVICDIHYEAQKHRRSKRLSTDFYIGYNLGYNHLHQAMNTVRERYRQTVTPPLDDYRIELEILKDASIQRENRKNDE